MTQDGPVTVSLFRIDRAQGRLWRGDEAIPLRRKVWEVLIYLSDRPGDLVSKGELLDAVWGETAIQEAVLTNCVFELRRALGDDRRAPRFIEVVRGRGFRWIAAGDELEPCAAELKPESPKPMAAPRGAELQALPLPGRAAELQQLNVAWQAALGGERQVAFVSGEPGIGKTTLVEMFLQSVSAATPILLARGQCIEILGESEPYLPLLDAVARLSKGPEGALVLDTLRRCAPTWLAQMPWLLDRESALRVERNALGATAERMLRELASGLDGLAEHRPLVLVIEDLHWADRSTLDLLSFLAQGSGAIRMLVIGSYRPADAIARRSPLITLTRELIHRRRALELALDHLSVAAIQAYLDQRFAAHDLPASVAEVVHRHTDGNPMFMTAVTDELVQRGILVEKEQRWQAARALSELDLGLPTSLKRMIECQIERLDDAEIRLLEAASAVGIEPSSQELESALEGNLEQIEDACGALAHRHQFLRYVGLREWPDGTRGERYAFAHALYQRTLYQRIPDGRKQRLHRRIADRLERGYASRPAEVAHELAAHLEAAGDAERCAKYLVLCGQTALRCASPHAARKRFRHALQVMELAPPGPARQRRQVAAWSGMASAHLYSKGWTAPDVAEAFARTEDLSRGLDGVDDAGELFGALLNAWAFHIARGEMARAANSIERMTAVVSAMPDGAQHCTLGAHATTLFLGGRVAFAAELFERALRLEASGDEWAAILHYIPRVHAFGIGAEAEWMCGNLQRASELAAEGLALARVLAHPLSEMMALDCTVVLAVLAGDRAMAIRRSDALADVSERQNVPFFALWARIYRSWLRACDSDSAAIADLGAAAATLRSLGFASGAMYPDLFQADALVSIGQLDEALAVIDATLACVATTGVRYFEAELHRLRGEALARHRPAQVDAGPSLRRAVAIARDQGARWWELRALSSLVRFLTDGEERQSARQQLGSLCESLNHSSAIPALIEARRLAAGT